MAIDCVGDGERERQLAAVSMMLVDNDDDDDDDGPINPSQVNKHVVDLEAAKARLRVVEKHASSSSSSSSAASRAGSSGQLQPQVKPPRNLPPTNNAPDGGKASGGNMKLGVGEDNYVKYNNSNGGGKSENR